MQIVEISLLVMAVVGYCNSAGNYGGIGGYGSGRAGGGSRYGSDGGGGEATRGSGGGGTISNFGEDRGGIGFGGSENRGFGSRGSFGGGFTGGFNQNQNTAPEPYKFDYQVTDEEGNVQYRMEEGDASGAVRGTYGYTDTQGVYRVVDYVADANGFRANVRTNEPGTDGKENRADVQMTVEDPPAGIQDRYSGGGSGGSYGSGIGVGVPVAQVSRISGGTGGAPGGVPSSWLTHVAPKVQTQKPKSSGGSSGYGSGNNIIKEKVGNKSSKSGY